MRPRWLLLLLLAWILWAAPALQAQEPSESPSPDVSLSPTPAVPLAELSDRLEQEQSTLESMQTALQEDPIGPLVDEQLPDLRRQIDARVEDSARLLANRPSIEEVRSAERGWRELGTQLPAWKQRLTQRVETLSSLSTQLEAVATRWQETLEHSRQEGVPAPILARITNLLETVDRCRQQLEREKAAALTRLNTVSEQDARVSTILNSLSEARTNTVYRLLDSDSPPLWALRDFSLTDTTESLQNQLVELDAYLARMGGSIVMHVLLVVGLVLLLSWADRRVEPWVAAEPKLQDAAQIFQTPVASALLLSVLLAHWLNLYPQAPTVVEALLGSVAMIPTLILMRRMLSAGMLPLTYGLIVFYLIGMVRLLLSSGQVAPRLLFLAEMLAGTVFMLWLLRTQPAGGQRRVIFLGRFAAFAFAVSFLAGTLGFMGLALLVGDTVLQSTYMAVLLYVALQVLDGLTMFALRSYPLNLLRVVQRHRVTAREWLMRLLDFMAVLAWLAWTLDTLSVLKPTLKFLTTALTARLAIGTLGISLGDVLAFGLTVWLSFQLSRLVRAALEEDVYTRVPLPRGIPYALSMMAHYTVLLLGFLLAVAALGLDLSRFTVLAGAFGVGLGLGLQSIVNNFVSGLILLFERPVKVNDVVQVGSDMGNLKEIGLRASVVRGWDGSEVIIPNGELISGRVTNFSLEDNKRRIDIDIGVEYGCRPRDVAALLEKTASENPDVVDDPAPVALFIGFGASSLDFTLRSWTDQPSRLLTIKSELGMRIYEVLEEAGIGIPFPQQTVHLATVSREAREVLRTTNGASKK